MVSTKRQGENWRPIVSVVIPCFNTHAYLEQTLSSLQAQTQHDIEIIVIDDGSTDKETVDYLDRLDDAVRLLRQDNHGLPSARNAGFAAARGEYVMPLDADDWLEPDAVEKLVLALRQHPGASFAFSHIQMEGEAQGVLKKNYNFFEQLFLNQLPYCLLQKKTLWQCAGGYDETMSRGYEDWEYNIRLGKMGHFGVVVPEPLFHYRVLKTGMLLSVSNRVHGELWETIRRKHAELYRVPHLLRLWLSWRKHASTYPLPVYFPWLIASQLFPRFLFSALFQAVRRFSHGRRVTALTKNA